MSLSQDAHLVRMINQIAANLGGGRSEDEAITAICHHLETFWAPSMKRRLIASLAHADSGLEPLARRAAQRLAERETLEAGQA